MEVLMLRYFFESAKNQSFSETAKKYMVPTTSVSASVKRLEQEIGCKLFDRNANRIVLNANGKRLYKSLIVAFSELDGAIEELSGPSNDVREIKLLVRGMRRKITDAIIEYNKKHPQVSFKTTFDFGETSFDDYDIIIDEESDIYKEYDGFELYSLKLYLKVSSSDSLCGKKLSLKQLYNKSFISMGDESNMQKKLTKACNRVGFSPDITVFCNDIECYEKFIASGMGIGVGREDSLRNGLVNLDVIDFDERYTIYVYYKKKAYYGNVKSFVDFLKKPMV